MAEDVKKNVEEKEMDWDSGISAEVEERNLPPVGEYGFTVDEFEKTLSKSGKKMAKITIKLDKEGQFWRINDYLVLTANMEWKLAQFFECLSLKKKGEPLTSMPWNQVLGSSGRVKIKHEVYEGKENCKVDRYLVSDAAKAPTAPANDIKAPEAGDVPFEV